MGVGWGGGQRKLPEEEDMSGILKEKVRSTSFSCRELGRCSPGKGTVGKRGIRHWQPLGMTNKLLFFLEL